MALVIVCADVEPRRAYQLAQHAEEALRRAGEFRVADGLAFDVYRAAAEQIAARREETTSHAAQRLLSLVELLCRLCSELPETCAEPDPRLAARIQQAIDVLQPTAAC